MRSASQPMPRNVPDISVVIDCGKCQVRPTVPGLIHTAYADAAAKAGVAIARDAQMTVTIKEYTDRNVATRIVSVLAGPLGFALKDEIKASVVVDGKSIPLKYSQRMPFLGIETVATKLGKVSFKAIAKSHPKE